MLKKIVQIKANIWLALAVGLVLGAIIILGIRFFSYRLEAVHYHANVAVYINGQRELYNGPQYYEETAATSCTVKKIASPLERAHMHDNVNSVVHVEDNLVTWGNFFQNINWGIGDTYLKSADTIYALDEQNSLTFMLNGQKVKSVAGLIIGDQDKLLVNYGNQSSDQIQTEYNGIQNQARKYDAEKDPAGCSGSRSDAEASERLKHLF